MMGRTHATSGAVAYLMLLPVAAAAGLVEDTDAVTVIAGAVTAAGAAMLPDLDHPAATISRSLGVFTQVLSRLVGTVSGGHRAGTHSVLGWLVGVGGAGLLGQVGGWPLGVGMTFLAVIALTALRVPLLQITFVYVVVCVLLAAVLVPAAHWQSPPAAAVMLAVGTGWAAHIAGDCLTREGCPLAWPLNQNRFALLHLRTDSWAERLLIGPGLGLAAIVLAGHRTDLASLLHTATLIGDRLADLIGAR